MIKYCIMLTISKLKAIIIEAPNMIFKYPKNFKIYLIVLYKKVNFLKKDNFSGQDLLEFIYLPNLVYKDYFLKIASRFTMTC